MPSSQITIAIDGGAGTGKGTTAKGVAEALGYIYVDTGAMYRAVTLWCLELNIQEADDEVVEESLAKLALKFIPHIDGEIHMYMNGHNVDMLIRTPEVDARVAKIAARPAVRRCLVAQQRDMATVGGVVMDGRDMGTVVVPNAELKVFLVCDFKVRAKRRREQLTAKGNAISLEEVEKSLRARDEIDYDGHNATSKKAVDAKELDTSALTIDQQINQVLQRAGELLGE